MDYHIEQLAIHCRICGKWVANHRGKTPYTVYNCSELAESLQQALAIDVNNDSASMHPQRLCKPCKVTIDRQVYARSTGAPMKRIIPFQWYTHTTEGCTVRK